MFHQIEVHPSQSYILRLCDFQLSFQAALHPDEEQPEKRVGNRRVAKYSFEMDEPQFGETTEIRIKVVDKYKKETVSDNEFEYYD